MSEIVRTPNSIKRYQDLLKYYNSNNKIKEVSDISYLIEQKFGKNENNPDLHTQK